MDVCLPLPDVCVQAPPAEGVVGGGRSARASVEGWWISEVFREDLEAALVRSDRAKGGEIEELVDEMYFACDETA